MNKRLIVTLAALCLLLIGIAPGLAGEKEKLPELINSGLEAYRQSGPLEALKTWVKGSAFENSREAMSQAGRFREIETFYGSYLNAELIRITRLSSTTRRIYFVMNYDSGPLFCAFTLYASPRGEIMSGTYNLHTDPNQILPQALMAK